ncbi:MAG: isoprenylcysteine carboxylmethyltransferase family protein, partial [Gemmatimonadetes bacterium]|nr:isoprenylcysteine carboxylmethyltransferase family protein [Gemmatimonadota bacterium]NIR81443.1 isoprenylcysteine carboxylmethyltransferase family protein [Gemmatimonadota bacterium]NIT90282.1 isoprenylcysteine carboxylmethyltransferase family protein [Gemmatimonadota bacterium]NIU34108.1 isoprenylcysteine carboxylmethyltransferase family protein [Gemmatimonadota bacterium]NIU38265.1 isoprenylcysteine carboxylmethyltransferase family protein [Gemmatimonadota bacterium]
MKKLLGFAYGSLVYLLFLGVFTYLILFVGDLWVPKSIDAGGSTFLSLSTAIAANVGLLALFGLQHSVMARQGFKRWWTRVVPWHLERSTYVLAASLVLAVVMWGWRPIPETIWSVEDPLWAGLLRGLFWTGWGIVLLS